MGPVINCKLHPNSRNGEVLKNGLFRIGEIQFIRLSCSMITHSAEWRKELLLTSGSGLLLVPGRSGSQLLPCQPLLAVVLGCQHTPVSPGRLVKVQVAELHSSSLIL